ncbi:MAG: hypothetical protein GF355_05155 [Candidatus Eisenbacteria bacterium]|nr:hypothetical protein [Candidatus Eisenbacteria bacterium]
MNDEHLDPIRERMIAALYGELPEEEEREFRKLLETDETLRAEWEDLQFSRAFLKKADAAEATPSFVFVSPLERPADAEPAQPKPPEENAWTSFWDRLLGAVLSPATGLAIVTAALVILVLAGFRVDRVDGGLVFRFGRPPEPVSSSAAPDGAEQSDRSAFAEPGAGVLQPAADPGAYMTRAEFAAYSDDLMRLMAAMMSDYEQRRDGQIAYMMRGFYDELLQRQRRDYEDLDSQLDRVWLNLVASERVGDGRLGISEGQEAGPGITPVNDAGMQRKEEDYND